MTEHSTDADLDWLAFQYAAGELLGPDLEAFESLLATDERACIAVARAVTLSQAVVAAEGTPSQRMATVASQRAGSIQSVGGPASRNLTHRLLAAATVACGLLFVGWLSVRTPREEAVSPDSAATVASLWVAGADEDAADEGVLPEVATIESMDEDPVPGWLMAAVTEEKQAMEDEEIIND